MLPQSDPAISGIGQFRLTARRRQIRLRALVYQLLLATALCIGGWYLVSTAAQNLLDLGVAAGFGFLSREAGFAIGETTLLSYSAADTYLTAIAVGFLNTLRVAMLAIVFSTVIGGSIGLARLSTNWLLAKTAGVYVELLRNVPLIVQLFFWYALITESLPAPGDALRPLPGFFLSNRGLVFPAFKLASAEPWLVVILCAAGVTAFIWLWHRGSNPSAGRYADRLFAMAALAFALGTVFLLPGAKTSVRVDYPTLTGFDFVGGASLSPEFSALLLGLALYTAAFIAEIVRAGVLSVDRGQFDAAYSLGLTQRQVTRFIVLPQALRVITPPVTSQYLNCTKNSSLAVAIGYPDLVSVANTTINQTGQAIEGVAIIMIVYLTISLVISAFMNWYNRHVALRGTTP
ncbi:MAG TPA: ABC transporter permease subunit [Candidatus Binatia bacterium]|jgi:general L-amino acid transport system permease protein